MLQTPQNSSGDDYATTVALLAGAFIFSPAVLLMSGPFGMWQVTLATVVSLAGVGLTWANWRRYTRLTVPSVSSQTRGSR